MFDWQPREVSGQPERISDYLAAGLMICEALAIRNAAANDEIAADFDALEKAIREIERQSAFLEEIKTSPSTIENRAGKSSVG